MSWAAEAERRRRLSLSTLLDERCFGHRPKHDRAIGRGARAASLGRWARPTIDWDLAASPVTSRTNKQQFERRYRGVVFLGNQCPIYTLMLKKFAVAHGLGISGRHRFPIGAVQELAIPRPFAVE